MEKTDEQLASLIEKLQEAGFKQAPEIIEGATRAIYLDGVVQVVFASTFILLFVIALIILMVGVNRKNEDLVIFGMFTSVPLFLLFSLVASLGNPWARLLDPEAVLYHGILNRLL